MSNLTRWEPVREMMTLREAMDFIEGSRLFSPSQNPPAETFEQSSMKLPRPDDAGAPRRGPGLHAHGRLQATDQCVLVPGTR